MLLLSHFRVFLVLTLFFITYIIFKTFLSLFWSSMFQCWTVSVFSGCFFQCWNFASIFEGLLICFLFHTITLGFDLDPTFPMFISRWDSFSWTLRRLGSDSGLPELPLSPFACSVKNLAVWPLRLAGTVPLAHFVWPRPSFLSGPCCAQVGPLCRELLLISRPWSERVPQQVRPESPRRPDLASAFRLSRRARTLWSGTATTPTVLAPVLKVAPALSSECLLVTVGGGGSFCSQIRSQHLSLSSTFSVTCRKEMSLGWLSTSACILNLLRIPYPLVCCKDSRWISDVAVSLFRCFHVEL